MKSVPDQLTVCIKLPLSINWKSIAGLNEAVQVFPDVPDLQTLYVIYVDPSELDRIHTELNTNDGVEYCEKIPARSIQ